MRKTMILLVLSLFTVVLFYSTASAQTPALFILTNVCKVTANNLGPIAAPTSQSNVATRTMFGGKFTAMATTRTQMVGSLGGAIWSFTFTNKGNATSPFTIKFQTASSNPAPSTWDAAFGNGSRSFNVTPAAGGIITVNVCITDQAPAQANGAYFRVRIVASNTAGNITTANGATNYTGDNGIAYGGNMGDNWQGVNGGTGTQKCVFVQQGTGYDGYFTLMIAAPVLNITKSIQSITKGGIASAPIPGATIQYRIFITNSGSAAGVSTRIVDTTPAAAVTWGRQVAITNLTASDTNMPNLAWSNQTGSLAAGGRAVVIYTVRIQ